MGWIYKERKMHWKAGVREANEETHLRQFEELPECYQTEPFIKRTLKILLKVVGNVAGATTV
jgi:hypothetical protein